MKKRSVLTVSVLASLLGITTVTFASDPVRLFVDGTEPYIEDAPQILEGRVMVPLKTVAQLFDKEVRYDKLSNTVHVDHPTTVITDHKESHIQVSGTLSETGMYQHLRIATPLFTRELPGENVENPSYKPQLLEADLDGDGTKEMLVLRTTGYGTGVYESEITVLRSNGEYIPVEDASFTFLKQFSGRMTQGGVELDVNDQQTLIPANQIETYDSYPIEQPGVGSTLYYWVEDDVLFVQTSVQISPAKFIGALRMSYTYKNGVLQCGNATFIPEAEERDQ